VLTTLSGARHWREYDARSWFYQIGIGPDLWPYFTFLLKLTTEELVDWALRVLPQGWSWSPGIAQTVAVAICVLAMRRMAVGSTARALPWIDNFILCADTLEDLNELDHHFQDLCKELAVALKPSRDEQEPLLNLDIDLDGQQFRVSEVWGTRVLVAYAKRVRRQPTQKVKTLWRMAGSFVYYTYTSSLSFGKLRSTLKDMATQSRLIHTGMLDWVHTTTISTSTIKEWEALAGSVGEWHPLPQPLAESWQAACEVALVVDAAPEGVGALLRDRQGQVTEWSDTWGDLLQTVGPIEGFQREDQTHREAKACLFYMDRAVQLGHQTVFMVNDNLAWVRSLLRRYSSSMFFMACRDAMEQYGLVPTEVGWGKGGKLSPADTPSRVGRTCTSVWGKGAKFVELRQKLEAYLPGAWSWRKAEDQVVDLTDILEGP
jgi:hypothetical protein